MARLSVIVPATDDPSTLDACRRSIRSALAAGDELIVVPEPPRSSPAAARNSGAAEATGDVLVFVDADVAVHADALERMRAAFDADPGLVAVFGSYDDRPAAPGVVSTFRNLLHHHVHQRAPGPAATFWAGLGGVRRSVFLAAGGFDAQRFRRPSIEDVELGTRLARLGRVGLDPRIQGTHLKAWTFARMVRSDFADRGVPWVQLLLRSRSFPAVLNLGWRERLSAMAFVSTAGALAWRRPGLAAGAFAVAASLNRSFYALLARRHGGRTAAAGVALHAVHHLTAAAAVPVGATLYAVEGATARLGAIASRFPSDCES